MEKLLCSESHFLKPRLSTYITRKAIHSYVNPYVSTPEQTLSPKTRKIIITVPQSSK